MKWFREKQEIVFDPEKQEPAVRKSICTGEMTAGFIDRQSGKFQEWKRVASQKELDDFRRKTGVKEIKTIY